MAVHRNMTGATIHVGFFKEYATHALRLADADITAPDRGKIVRVNSDQSYWLIVDESPLRHRRVDQAIGTARVVIDATTGLTIAGSPHDLGFRLPDNATILRSWYEVVTAFVSGTSAATVRFDVETDDPGGIKAATVISDGSWALGYHDALPDGTATTFTAITTAIRAIQATVAVEDLTDGKVYLWIEYIDRD